MAELYWLKRPIAHRGLHDASRGIIENSMSAVRAAMGKGYAIEVDLQRAAGGMPVSFTMKGSTVSPAKGVPWWIMTFRHSARCA